jgi:hypothetical protein
MDWGCDGGGHLPRVLVCAPTGGVCGARGAQGPWGVPAGTRRWRFRRGDNTSGPGLSWAFVASRLVMTACPGVSYDAHVWTVQLWSVEEGRGTCAWHGLTTVQYPEKNAVEWRACAQRVERCAGKSSDPTGSTGSTGRVSQGFRGRWRAETALARYLSNGCGLSAADWVLEYDCCAFGDRLAGLRMEGGDIAD